MTQDPAPDVAARLAALFPADRLGWKPQAVSGNRALAIAYIDARDVMDRLDAALGVDGWQDEYEALPDGLMLCRLRVRLGDEWITKVDVGGESDQKDAGDRHKAAVSDALKRAAVKFGIGRYLYSLPAQWCDYDPQKKQFARVPTLPDWADPDSQKKAPAARPEADEPRINEQERERLAVRIREVAARTGSTPREVSGGLLQHFKVNGISRIPAGRYQDALAWLADQKPTPAPAVPQNGAQKEALPADPTTASPGQTAPPSGASGARAGTPQAPSTAPASAGPPPAAEKAPVNKTARILTLDGRLKDQGRTWKQALAFLRIDTPQGWEEPESLNDLESLTWLSDTQLDLVEKAARPRKQEARP